MSDKRLKAATESSETARFATRAALPSPYELAIIAEECAEVIHRATKAQRFGLLEVQPGQPWSNSQRLAIEIGDVLALVDEAIAAKMVDPETIERARNLKRDKLAVFMQFRRDGRARRETVDREHAHVDG